MKFGRTDVAIGVFALVKRVVVHLLSHFACIVDLVLEDLEDIIVGLVDCISAEHTSA